MTHGRSSPTHSGTHPNLKVDLEFVLLRDARVLQTCVYALARMYMRVSVCMFRVCMINKICLRVYVFLRYYSSYVQTYFPLFPSTPCACKYVCICTCTI